MIGKLYIGLYAFKHWFQKPQDLCFSYVLFYILLLQISLINVYTKINVLQIATHSFNLIFTYIYNLNLKLNTLHIALRTVI